MPLKYKLDVTVSTIEPSPVISLENGIPQKQYTLED